MTEVIPRDTVYIRNLNEKVSRTKLVAEIRSKFGKFGNVTHVYVSQRNLGLKGQAWVSFEQVDSATAALYSLNTEYLFDKPMDIYYAKGDSYELQKKSLGDAEFQKVLDAKKTSNSVKRQKLESGTRTGKADGEGKTKPRFIDNKEPNKTLLVQGIPKDLAEEKLESTFSAFGGFVELKLVRIRDVAFVEFSKESDAVQCRQSLGQIFEVDSKEIFITFAKK
ncbi:unnamed protein product [Kuraishia capsulata CBS 1993]|uniref:RRM domain-containing protein n=1 Tax=Kuraishia capsulata CBS 1993 TaxID=1382522 RepID=W6MVI0_9ASCO|nr:uncharacterized protein KUCA_T00005967001 [Kuraishia capsulata CBS 1993]CDK29972.1 unnamed protein product [Kuraishia capsulata CBS 1993]